MASRWQRYAPLTGVVFVLLLVGNIVLTSSAPGSDETGTKVIAYYRDHRNQQMIANLLGVIAAVALLFFAGTLLAALRSAPRNLVVAALGGAAIMGVGGACFSALGYALADVPDKLDPAAAQALNVLNNDFFFPIAAGVGVFFLAVGLAIETTRLLPRWMGWLAILIGVVAVTPAGFAAQMAALLWVLVASLLMLVRPPREGDRTVSRTA